MPTRITDLPIFLTEMIALLELVAQCERILFRAGFRENLQGSTREVVIGLNQLQENDYVRNPERYESMRLAGLTGVQLQLKLESFESASTTLAAEGGIDPLDEVLDKGGIIIGSLVSAIPGIGSFAQEFIDFLLKELRKSLRLWPR